MTFLRRANRVVSGRSHGPTAERHTHYITGMLTFRLRVAYHEVNGQRRRQGPPDCDLAPKQRDPAVAIVRISICYTWVDYRAFAARACPNQSGIVRCKAHPERARQSTGPRAAGLLLPAAEPPEVRVLTGRLVPCVQFEIN
jgi:hypothetical protein